jgi:signal transduction histidine kinase
MGATMNNDVLIKIAIVLLALSNLCNIIHDHLQDKQLEELKQQIVELTAKEDK